MLLRASSGVRGIKDTTNDMTTTGNVRDDACNETPPSSNVTGNRSNETVSSADCRAAVDMMTTVLSIQRDARFAKPCRLVWQPCRSSPELWHRP